MGEAGVPGGTAVTSTAATSLSVHAVTTITTPMTGATVMTIPEARATTVATLTTTAHMEDMKTAIIPGDVDIMPMKNTVTAASTGSMGQDQAAVTTITMERIMRATMKVVTVTTDRTGVVTVITETGTITTKTATFSKEPETVCGIPGMTGDIVTTTVTAGTIPVIMTTTSLAVRVTG